MLYFVDLSSCASLYVLFAPNITEETEVIIKDEQGKLAQYKLRTMYQGQ
jgi:hypothetical protein